MFIVSGDEHEPEHNDVMHRCDSYEEAKAYWKSNYYDQIHSFIAIYEREEQKENSPV